MINDKGSDFARSNSFDDAMLLRQTVEKRNLHTLPVFSGSATIISV